MAATGDQYEGTHQQNPHCPTKAAAIGAGTGRRGGQRRCRRCAIVHRGDGQGERTGRRGRAVAHGQRDHGTPIAVRRWRQRHGAIRARPTDRDAARRQQRRVRCYGGEGQCARCGFCIAYRHRQGGGRGVLSDRLVRYGGYRRRGVAALMCANVASYALWKDRSIKIRWSKRYRSERHPTIDKRRSRLQLIRGQCEKIVGIADDSTSTSTDQQRVHREAAAGFLSCRGAPRRQRGVRGAGPRNQEGAQWRSVSTGPPIWMLSHARFTAIRPSFRVIFDKILNVIGHRN